MFCVSQPCTMMMIGGVYQSSSGHTRLALSVAHAA